jgi:hypothetical protein|tara:strand:- start:1610 stop:2092 length:483 start_codon:yes stop_codon:yes gene_type:complete
MKAHTTYKIYPKAINEFIKENYDLKSINFGNIKNNVNSILQKLDIETILECEWDVSPLYFFDKVGVSKNNNKPSDFDEYSNFRFSFSAKNGVSNEEFEKAITILEFNFINKYQERLSVELQEIKNKLKLQKKKKDILTYTLTGLVLIILVSIVFYLKNQN